MESSSSCRTTLPPSVPRAETRAAISTWSPSSTDEGESTSSTATLTSVRSSPTTIGLIATPATPAAPAASSTAEPLFERPSLTITTSDTYRPRWPARAARTASPMEVAAPLYTL